MIRLLLIGFAGVVTACSGSDSDDGGSAPVGRGTDACRTWQAALCDTLGRCGGSSSSVATCRDQAAAVSCLSDQAANDCVTALAAPSCVIPAACQIKSMADPAPAVTACTQFLDVLCTAVERCGSDKATCYADANTAEVCTGVIGYKPGLDDCIDVLKSVSCDTTSTPAECKSVFLK